MDLRSGPDVTDLALDEDCGIDAFESLDRLSGLLHVFFKRQRGDVEDDRN